jgi:hypothetical protein
LPLLRKHDLYSRTQLTNKSLQQLPPLAGLQLELNMKLTNITGTEARRPDTDQDNLITNVT